MTLALPRSRTLKALAGGAVAIKALIDELSRVYPAAQLLTNEAQLTTFRSDGLPAKARAGAVVLPEIQAEVVS